MREKILAPSILAADFTKLGEQIKEVEKAGAKYLHFDVMDGMFVPSISFGMPVLQTIRKASDMIYDVHLMIEKPERYIEVFAEYGADILTVHVETIENNEILKKINELGVKVGLSLNPETPIETVYPYLEYVDMVLVMTVHPGFGGQKYIDDCTDKVAALFAEIQNRNLDLLPIRGESMEQKRRALATNGKEVFDATGVHPESYAIAEDLLRRFGFTTQDVGTANLALLKFKAEQYGTAKLAKELGCGEPPLEDIIKELEKPGRDIRDDAPAPILSTDVLDINDLKPDMQLNGTVRNVVDFGCFVDIGVHHDGLLHISEMSDRFIKHPSEVLKVGDIVKVKVLAVDVKKKRISLSMKNVK